jgi:hypothetical protein
MHRRTFIKGVLFSIPSLCLKPIAALSNRLEDTLTLAPARGLSMFFIGAYGRQVLEHFKRLAPREPVLRPCDHLPNRDASRMRLIEVGHNCFSNEDLLSTLYCDTAIVVYDRRQPIDLVLAGVLCRLIKKVYRTSLTIAMSPFAAQLTTAARFDLSLQTWQNQTDFMPYVLRTLYKTYCGCSCLGNLLCLKVQLQDILYAECSRGMLMAHSTFYDIRPNDSFQDSFDMSAYFRTPVDHESMRLAWVIVEMHHANPEPLKTMASITDNILSDKVDRLILPHMSLASKQYRLTVFGFG